VGSCVDGFGQVGEGIAFLLSARDDDGEQRLDESTAFGTLGSEREFPPDDGRSQGPLGSVVGGLDPIDIQPWLGECLPPWGD